MSEILFADDDISLRQLVTEILRSAGYRVRLAANGFQALAEVRAMAPDLVLLDYRMDGPDGFQVCKELKTDPRYEHIPVLILTGEGQIENRLLGFEAGADDYLAKPFDPRELLARVGALLRLTRSGLERNPTSGLPGGHAIEREFDRRRAEGRTFTVCYLDLDHFKAFNDRFGFSVADAVIRAVGEILRGVADSSDAFAGHVGGDDFVVICRPEEGLPIAEAAQRRLAERLPRHLPEAILRQGWYEGVDRYGQVRQYPVTRLSAAVARIDPARWSSLLQVGEAVAEIKHRAKRVEATGIVEVDLR